MKTAHRLSISAAAFLIGLGASPVLAQTAAATDNASVTTDSYALSGNNQNADNANISANGNDTLNSKAIDRLVDQDLDQQHRIEQGLKDGQLTTAEAARLERGESRVDQLESKALDNGSLSAQEAAQIRQAEYGMDNRITQLENNGSVSGSASANADMAADVQRNINQDRRIDRDIDDGNLTPTEVSALEGGQATVDSDEFQDGRNNQITSSEQQNIQGAENTQGMDIRNDAHNGMTVSSGTSGQGNDHWRDRDSDHFASYGHNGTNGYDRDDNDNDHYADNGQQKDYWKHEESPNGNDFSSNQPTTQQPANVAASGNMSGDMTANNLASNTMPVANNNIPVAGNTSADIATNASANSGAVPMSSSANIAAGNAAPVMPISATTQVTTHVAPPHIPVAHK